MKTIVIAIGGNSLIKDARHMSVPDQYAAVVETSRHITDLLERGYRVVITHGNGPQVGFILLRSEHSRGILHQVPLDSIVAVEKWIMVQDAGRGWRRVVASPRPVRIIESAVVKHLVKDGYVVIAAGGGGIPVVADAAGNLSGVAAVIDKDLASAVLAEAISADLLVISTAVEKVCLNFGKPNQRALNSLTVAQARQYIAEGHFHPGSMLPKIQACLQFIEHGGHEALITCPEALSAALEGKTGTRITAWQPVL